MRPLSVVKLGGRLVEEPDLRAAALQAVAARFRASERFIVVHGGGLQVDAMLARLGITKRTHEGLRITDAPTLDVAVSILAGLVNKSLVAELCRLGVGAAGFSGADGGTLVAERHPPIGGVDLGFVGRVVSCGTALARSVLKSGMIPVIASVGIGPGGALLNINADAAASALASALGAKRLVFLTDVEGLFDAAGRVVGRLTPDQAGLLLASGAVRGGMRPKLAASLEALGRGVREVVIAGPGRHADALFARKGGTHLVAA